MRKGDLMTGFGLSTLLAIYDAQVTGIVQRGVDARRFAWSARFQDETTRVESDFAIRGAGHSGALLKPVADVCVKEIETRASDLCEDLYRALVATGVRPSLELPGNYPDLSKLIGALRDAYGRSDKDVGTPRWSFNKRVAHITKDRAPYAAGYDHRPELDAVRPILDEIISEIEAVIGRP
jgi:hypothetical protein